MGRASLLTSRWWRREDSNLRPLAYEANELPTALPRYIVCRERIDSYKMALKSFNQRPKHSTVFQVYNLMPRKYFLIVYSR